MCNSREVILRFTMYLEHFCLVWLIIAGFIGVCLQSSSSISLLAGISISVSGLFITICSKLLKLSAFTKLQERVCKCLRLLCLVIAVLAILVFIVQSNIFGLSTSVSLSSAIPSISTASQRLSIVFSLSLLGVVNLATCHWLRFALSNLEI